MLLNLWVSLVGSTPLVLRILNFLLRMVLTALVGVLTVLIIMGKCAAASPILLTASALFPL
jgi:hypothetical protein